MAVVSGYTISEEQYGELQKWSTEEPTLRISCWADGTVTVDDGDTVIIEFEPEGGA